MDKVQLWLRKKRAVRLKGKDLMNGYVNKYTRVLRRRKNDKEEGYM